MKNVVIIIPVLNPEDILENYIDSLISADYKKIIVVNDGSDEKYKDTFARIAAKPECDVITHEVNMGKGRGLKNAIKYYLDNGLQNEYIGVITVDGDGQHTLPDIDNICRDMNDNPDTFVLGERHFDGKVPFRSKFGNSCTKVLFRMMYGMKICDTQTGLRGLPNCCLDSAKELAGDRYEYEMNMLIWLSRSKVKFLSEPIETVYEEGNTSSHFNVIRDSFKIYKVMFGGFFKFLVSSLSASVIDLALFSLFVYLIKGKVATYIMLSTVMARVISSLYNFTVNRKVVFKSDEKQSVLLVKYYILCVIQMLLSGALVTLIKTYLGGAETLLKIIVDVILFLISYRIQRNLIFKEKLD